MRLAASGRQVFSNGPRRLDTMTRFLHTADWQLGAHLAFLGSRAAAARGARMQTVRRILELAAAEEVDFTVVAGDVFDSPDVSDEVVRELFEMASECGGPNVYLLPGNHDPAGPGSLWERSIWDGAPSRLHVLTTPCELEVASGAKLYACPIRQKTSREDPTAWIPSRTAGDTTVRLALAHGSLDQLPRKGNFPIATSRAMESGLDYVALGDWHTPLISERVAYSGAPEPCSFREKDSGHVLLVEIEGSGAAPQIESRRVASLDWQSLSERLNEPADIDEIVAKISEPRSRRVVDLHLRVRGQELEGLAEGLCEDLSSELFFLRSRVEVFDLRALPGGTLGLAEEIDDDLRRRLTQLRGNGSEGAGDVADPELAGCEEADVVEEARRQLALSAAMAVEESA